MLTAPTALIDLARAPTTHPATRVSLDRSVPVVLMSPTPILRPRARMPQAPAPADTPVETTISGAVLVVASDQATLADVATAPSTIAAETLPPLPATVPGAR